MSLIHPSANISEQVKKIEPTCVIEENACIGDRVYIGHYSIIRPGVRLYPGVEIRAHCFIAEDVIIMEDSHIFQFSNISKGSVIEEKVWIGPKTTMTNTSNIAHFRPYPTRIHPIHVLRGARIGGGCTFVPGVTVGENAFIWAGSLITKDVPDNTIVRGRPARFIDYVPKEERI